MPLPLAIHRAVSIGIGRLKEIIAAGRFASHELRPIVTALDIADAAKRFSFS